MSDAPRRLLLASAVLLVLVLLVIASAAVGRSTPSEVRTDGRITLEIPSATLPDDPDATTSSTTRPTTTSNGPSTTASTTTTRPSTTTSPPPVLETYPDPHDLPSGGIYGQVVDAHGMPLPGVCVRTPSSIDVDIAMTDADGMFALADVRPGRAVVSLVVGEAGCLPVSGTSTDAAVDVVADLWMPVLITVTLRGQ